jgi:hypothetical protein
MDLVPLSHLMSHLDICFAVIRKHNSNELKVKAVSQQITLHLPADYHQRLHDNGANSGSRDLRADPGHNEQ